MQVPGRNKLCGNVHQLVYDAISKVHQGLFWNACQHGPKIRQKQPMIQHLNSLAIGCSE
ncbi:hypothetical protein QJS10_CPB15g01895 [Acorus calamus]|uniref:Uncharacterized protein n=1 Tax=Acorus calamus TaxID=4465 RepID=A0AAV9D449_ACOCL|nr:hypothetical protein QJS10_CPB15g01895 [Acorus calamus]